MLLLVLFVIGLVAAGILLGASSDVWEVSSMSERATAWSTVLGFDVTIWKTLFATMLVVCLSGVAFTCLGTLVGAAG